MMGKSLLRGCLFILSICIFFQPMYAQQRAMNRVSVDGIQEKCGVEYGLPSGIAKCLFEEDRRYGSQLTKAYRRLLSQQNSSQKERLRKSQRAWLEYQKHFCEFHGPHYQYEAPGVPFPPGVSESAHARCLLETTIRRLNELRDLLENE